MTEVTFDEFQQFMHGREYMSYPYDKNKSLFVDLNSKGIIAYYLYDEDTKKETFKIRI